VSTSAAVRGRGRAQTRRVKGDELTASGSSACFRARDVRVMTSSGRFDAHAVGSASSSSKEETVKMHTGVDDEVEHTRLSLDEQLERGATLRGGKTYHRTRKFTARDARCVVLAGGADERNPLTRARARSAVHLGGIHRLIDFPMSNLVNSGMRQIYVMTQYNSHSLISHVNRAFPAEMFGGYEEGFVETLPTTQTREHGTTWSTGSADCVARALSQGSLTKLSYEIRMEDECLRELGSLTECKAFYNDKVTIILAAEQLYEMDFSALLEQHLQTEADITVATCNTVKPKEAKNLGVMDIDERTGNVLSFLEKPNEEQLLEFMQCSTETELEDCTLHANMGVYVFNNAALEELLAHARDGNNGNRYEFGLHVLPYAIQAGYHVSSFEHKGYWRPMRTLTDYYNANIELATGGPASELLNGSHPVYTKPNFLPPSTFFGETMMEGSIVSDGCVIKSGSKIRNSIIGPCAVIDENVTLDGVVFVGRDELLKRAGSEVPDIGAGSVLRKCIVDSDAIIGKNVSILNEAGVQELDATEDGYIITEGIVTILGNAIIPDGFTL